MSYSMETLYEIWDDKNGNKIEIGPDRDSLGLIEIRVVDGGVRVADITLTTEQAKLVAQALELVVLNKQESE